jgi:hypothetical protein
MESRMSLSRSRDTQSMNGLVEQADAGERAGANVHGPSVLALAGIPAGVLSSAALGRRGEYDAKRLRSQREIIRDVMLSAAECDTWLTLGELRALTRYGEASISAQLRHLRKAENGGFDVGKRHREDAGQARPGVDGRGECVWEYRIARGDAEQGSVGPKVEERGQD